MVKPLVLDLDGGVAGFDECVRLDLRHWEEAIRFGCGTRIWERFAADLGARLPAGRFIPLLGSGDFHHVSHLLLRRLPLQAPPVDVVVFDNHPDNMRFPFGIHCGSWVHHAAALPQVRCVHVVGITSDDAGAAHAWENHLRHLRRGRVHYWTLGVRTGWSRLAGVAAAVHAHDTSDALLGGIGGWLGRGTGPVYLSIDKDVFAPAVVTTNWDQGQLRLEDVLGLVDALRGRLVGADVTGEVSTHRYSTGWKRLLSALDRQPAIEAAQLAGMQQDHLRVNRILLPRIAAAFATG